MFEDMETRRESIAARIRYHMKKVKISQPELAAKIRCSRDTVYCYVNGKTREENMNIGLLKKMAQYFGLDEYYFFNEYLIFIDATDIPVALKNLRKKRGMSQKKFADKMNIPLSSYKKYETDEVRLPGRYWNGLKTELQKGKQ